MAEDNSKAKNEETTEKKSSLSTPVKLALIGLAGTIVAAIIAGIFNLIITRMEIDRLVQLAQTAEANHTDVPTEIPTETLTPSAIPDETLTPLRGTQHCLFFVLLLPLLTNFFQPVAQPVLQCLTRSYYSTLYLLRTLSLIALLSLDQHPFLFRLQYP